MSGNPELGLRELGLPDLADMFREAYSLVGPLLPEIRRPGGDYYDVIELAGHTKRIDELSSRARTVLLEIRAFILVGRHTRGSTQTEYSTPNLALHRMAAPQSRLANRASSRGAIGELNR